MDKALFTSGNTEWETPQDLFDILNKVYKFDLDACATPENAKCPRYFTKAQDGLSQEWKGKIWCNPPYGREIEKWVKKAHESYKAGATVVMLLPARTDTKWIHEWVFRSAISMFLKGRLRFGESNNSAPFPSMLAFYGGSVEMLSEIELKLKGHVVG